MISANACLSQAPNHKLLGILFERGSRREGTADSDTDTPVPKPERDPKLHGSNS